MTDKQPDSLRYAEILENSTNYYPESSSMPDLRLADIAGESAALLRAQHKQIAAYKLLTESQEAQLSQHRAQADKFREAIATLQSEREANVILTADIERKNALLRRMVDAWDEPNNGLADCYEVVEAIKQELSQ